MGGHVSIIEVINRAGLLEQLPDGLEPAIKFVKPDWTTYGGFNWWQPGRRWIQSPDDHFDPVTCTSGGLHVANTVVAAQSGGSHATHCLLVGVKPSECGDWDDGKRKATNVYIVSPIDLVNVICRHGGGADLRYADLRYANLRDADLRDAIVDDGMNDYKLVI